MPEVDPLLGTCCRALWYGKTGPVRLRVLDLTRKRLRSRGPSAPTAPPPRWSPAAGSTCTLTPINGAKPPGTFTETDHESSNRAQLSLTEDGDDKLEGRTVGRVRACVCVCVGGGYLFEMTLLILLAVNIFLEAPGEAV